MWLSASEDEIAWSQQGGICELVLGLLVAGGALQCFSYQKRCPTATAVTQQPLDDAYQTSAIQRMQQS